MAYTPADSKTYTRPYDGGYLSLYSAQFEPAVIRRLYEKYGKQFGVIDFLRMAGSEVSLSRETITSFSQGALERPMKIGAEISSITGGLITFKIDADSYDASNNAVVRVGDTVFIPGYYFSKTYDCQFRIQTVGATAAADSTMKSFESGLSLANNIPADTNVQVGPTMHARGTDQPDAKSRAQYSQNFTTAISKETTDFDGGVQAQQLYAVDAKAGGKGLWGMALADAEFTLDSTMSAELWSGQENDNSLTETNKRSTAATVKGTKGMWKWADENGQDHAYIDSFTVKDLDAIDDLFKTTGVMCQYAGFLTGHKLFKQVQDAAHDYIAQYSGGTDLVSDNMTQVGFTPVKWNRADITYRLVNLAQLSNHQTFGANDQNFWTYAGLVIPDEQVTITDSQGIYNSYGTEGGKVKLPNVAIGYLDNNQENRKRIVQQTSGVNGMNYTATNSYDVVQMNFLSEYALIANEVEKWVRLMKDGTY
jgi:hypothetical protein